MNRSLLNYFGLNGNEKIKLLLIFGSSATVGYLTYLTYKTFLNHRKYRHIPGPPNKGYSSFNSFKNHF